jgi:hypothetical protein
MLLESKPHWSIDMRTIFAGDYIKAAKGVDFDYYRLQIMTRF